MFNLTQDDRLVVQVEATSLWDVVMADSCGCTELHKPCNQLISDGEYLQAKLPCGYACEEAETRLWYFRLLRDNDLLLETYPVLWKKKVFRGELETTLNWLQTWDPNGDWDQYDVLVTPYQTIEVLENLKEALMDNCQDVPSWVDTCIDYLMLFML